jgi:type I restriction enzyme S subunit
MIQQKELRTIAKIIMGQSPDGSTYNNEGIGMPLLNGPTEFGTHHPTPILYTIDSKRECEKGDLIFCVRGSTTGRMNWADRVYSLGRGVCSFKGKSDLETKYIYYCVELFLPSLLNLAGGSTFPNLNKDDIGKFKIPYPENIDRIASILSAYDDLIEVNNQRIKLLEETARELYKEWFVRMRFPGYKKAKFVKGVPEGWEVMELKDFGKIHTGKTPPTKVREYYGGEIPFIKTPDLHKNQFIFETEEYLTDKGNNTQKRSCLPKGSICVSCIGTGGIVGLTTAEKSQTNQQINSLIPANKKYTEFLYYAICDLKETIELFGGTGATMTNLSKGKFEKLKILFANKELVEKYNSLVSPIFEQIQTIQQQNTQLRQIRDRLLPRLISGKLQVKEK